jgi:hypothetical protein
MLINVCLLCGYLGVSTFVLFLVLGFELMVSHLLGRHFTT